MRKSIEYSAKAEEHTYTAAYWESQAKLINLFMPESLDFFENLLGALKKEHQGLKDGTIERSHSFSLTYAKKRVNETEKSLELAKLLWG